VDYRQTLERFDAPYDPDDPWHAGADRRIFVLMRSRSCLGRLLSVLVLLMLAGCGPRIPPAASVEPPAPVSAAKWREIAEEIWMASSLARAEAEGFAREAMQRWMVRVREKTEHEFVPWYTGYWAQQWIGLKTGWYEMNTPDGEAAVDDYLVAYLQERFDELVLEPAGEAGNPRTITEQSAALYVRLLSEQLQCIPGMYAVPPQSLRNRLERFPLIVLPGRPPSRVPLSRVMQLNGLSGEDAYQALLARTASAADAEELSSSGEHLQEVAEDAVARLVAELPVRAGGSAAALVVGQALGMFISAGVVVWSAVSHDLKRPEIESQLRAALGAGLDEMWQALMEDPETGVLYPVDHMSRQIETALFPVIQHQAELPF